jgi:hypothetical protein
MVGMPPDGTVLTAGLGAVLATVLTAVDGGRQGRQVDAGGARDLETDRSGPSARQERDLGRDPRGAQSGARGRRGLDRERPQGRDGTLQVRHRRGGITHTDGIGRETRHQQCHDPGVVRVVEGGGLERTRALVQSELAQQTCAFGGDPSALVTVLRDRAVEQVRGPIDPAEA